MESKNPQHPGRILKENFLDPLGISPYRLAKEIGVHVRRVSEIIKGNSKITTDTAIRLGLFFNVPARWWLEMQAQFDSEQSSRIEELKKIVRPFDRLSEVLVTPKGVRFIRSKETAPKIRESIFVSNEILDRLRTQVGKGKLTAARTVETIAYEDGSRALVGRDK